MYPLSIGMLVLGRIDDLLPPIQKPARSQAPVLGNCRMQNVGHMLRGENERSVVCYIQESREIFQRLKGR
jgi:hypothetical protein